MEAEVSKLKRKEVGNTEEVELLITPAKARGASFSLKDIISVGE
jgi:hypothetical protein